MNFLSQISPIIITLLIFGVLVLVHEWGHFIVAKKSGILVEEFSIGMGPLIYAVQKGETKYSIRLLPIGGYCSMYGEDAAEYNERAFNSKSVWARIAVIAMGPMMNFVFAFVLVFGLSATAAGVILPEVDAVVEGSSAQEQGMQPGDRIIRVDGYSIHTYEDLYMSLEEFDGGEIPVTVKRGSEKIEMQIQPTYSQENGRWLIGFEAKVKTGLFSEPVEGFEKMSVWETIRDGFFTMVFYVKSVVVGFVRLFSFHVSPDEVAGPIGIVQIVGDSMESGMQYSLVSALKNVLNLAALLSTNLGVINLFPIPAVDGGRLVFLFLEAIRGKAIDPNKEGFIHFIGFVLLMGCMVLIAFNDISRLITG